MLDDMSLYIREIGYLQRSSENHPGIPEGDYWKKLMAVNALKGAQGLTFSKPVTFFVGENGMGKSTLLEAIAVEYGFNAEGGTRNFNFSTKATHSGLCNHLKITKGANKPKDGFFLRAESFYNVATEYERVYGCGLEMKWNNHKSFHEESHGESFMGLVKNRFGGNGFYMLDEPEAALSPTKLLELLTHIDRLVQNDSQFLIATHSPIVMAYPNAEVLYFTEDGLKLVDYKETEHYIVSRNFLNNPEKFLEILLGR